MSSFHPGTTGILKTNELKLGSNCCKILIIIGISHFGIVFGCFCFYPGTTGILKNNELKASSN